MGSQRRPHHRNCRKHTGKQKMLIGMIVLCIAFILMGIGMIRPVGIPAQVTGGLLIVGAVLVLLGR